MTRRLLLIVGAIGLLSVGLIGFTSIYGGGSTGGSIYGGGSTGGSIFGGSAGTAASGQFVSIFSGATVTAPTFVQSCHANTGGTRQASVSCTMTVTAGNAVALIAFSNAAGSVGTTDTAGCADNNSGSYVFASIRNNTNGLKACTAANHAGGSTQFTFTFQAGIDWGAIDVVEIAGLAASNLLDQQASNNTTGANATTGTTSATTHASDFVITALNQALQATMTCDAAYTQIDNVNTFNTDQSWATCYKVVSSTGTQSATYTTSSAAYSALIVALKGL